MIGVVDSAYTYKTREESKSFIIQTSTTYLNPILLNDAQVRQFLIVAWGENNV